MLITGARSSTYLQRRQLLPAADFEVFESGGRIWRGGQPDRSWSQELLNATGFAGSIAFWQRPPPPSERHGTLWDVFREMQSQGWALDAHGYYTQFRVRRSPAEPGNGGSLESRFETDWGSRLAALGLAHAVNLGHVDVFPSNSGKANAARYIMEKLRVHPDASVALFDDDNDIVMGKLCGRGLLPGVTSDSVRRVLAREPFWEAMLHRGPLGTEVALERVLALVEPPGSPG